MVLLGAPSVMLLFARHPVVWGLVIESQRHAYRHTTHVYVYIYVYIQTYIYVQIHIYIYTHIIYIYTHTRTCVPTCVYTRTP